MNNPNPNSPYHVAAIIALMIVAVGTTLGIYQFLSSQKIPSRSTSENTKQQSLSDKVLAPIKPSVAAASDFAAYSETPVSIKPQIPTYSVDANLNNVTNAKDFSLSSEAKNVLSKNAFFVATGYSREFFPLYESNRYQQIPNFVTTDSILHNYHLVFDHLLKKLEEEKLAPEAKKLSANMLTEALNHYTSLKGTQWENAAKRNVGFFAVANKLIDPSAKIPDIVTNEVSQELTLINAHQGITVSPVMSVGGSTDPLKALKEDYSQYVPRGHYDKSEQLKNYFKAMMWYGRLTFRLKNDDEIKSGLLITLALNKDQNQTSWNTIYEPTNFFVGKSDDITYYQFKELLAKTYGKETDVKAIATDANKFSAFVTETKKLEPPQINSVPIFAADIQPNRDEEIKGFRFMGQRFTVDATIFQNLVERSVKDRFLPRGLDIPAAFGSAEAYTILDSEGETKYGGYTASMNKVKNYISEIPQENWTQNLYWAWMYTLRPLTTPKPEGYPTFMRNTAWTRKDLNTFLGSWTELKHDTILYAKQTYAELGGGGDEVKKDDRGYVEPNVEVYARLTSLLKMTREALELRGLLSPAMKENLTKMEQLSLSLKIISEKELANQKLNDEEYELIRSYGGQLEHFWLDINKEDMEKNETSPSDYLLENPAAIIADVATDPNGKVLEEGIGFIHEIYVVVPIDGKLRIAKGGTFSYYEFHQPISDRLTDKKWREMLESQDEPKLPTWTQVFRAKTE